MKKLHSEFLNWNWYDLVKGSLLCMLVAILTTSYQMLTTIPPHYDIKVIAVSSITALVAYLIKQLTTNSKGELLEKE
jgi:hypothetical protein